ncbi:restriction endonuclease subunit S [Nitrosomonas ureae]|uniref:Type I restriction enzyme, S subunit n=1 Tax=Nitrosomonas ureae TaxID=44577 RepID=A0A286A718_9PROT|nr:restriction endonuclease subunit S [Nitrosomonas ureae]SOD17702.1 type I restriction enzyme, S subunit [Nitrosomonas ureae]
MRQGWEVKKLGDVCDVIGGGTPSKAISKFYEGDIYWATVRDMKDNVIKETEYKITEDAVKKSSTNIIPKGNVIIATRVGLGKICLIENDTAINQDLRAIVPKPNSGLTIGYLFQWFKSISHLIVEEGTGATIQGVKLPFIKGLAIPLPPIPEQQRIVAILDECFSAIAKVKANTEQNLKNTKELFESYLESVFENKGEDWEEKKLSEVCTKITDGTHQTPKYFNEGVVFLSSKNVTSGKIDWINIKYIDEKQHLEMQKRVAPKINDILLAKNGTTGVAAIVDKDLIFDIYVSLALIRVLHQVLPNFMLYFINSSIAKKQFNKRLKGSGVPNLHLEEIREVIIPFPTSHSKQQIIVQQLDSLRAETEKLESIYQQKIKNLEELKKSILKKAFSGELISAQEITA